MSTRIYVFKDTDKKIESIAKSMGLTKSEVVEMAVNRFHRRLIKDMVLDPNKRRQ